MRRRQLQIPDRLAAKRGSALQGGLLSQVDSRPPFVTTSAQGMTQGPERRPEQDTPLLVILPVQQPSVPPGVEEQLGPPQVPHAGPQQTI